MSEEQIVIDETNFGDFFHDVRFHRPKPGQVMARFAAKADFVGGTQKKDVIDLLKKDKAYQATAVLRKLHHAKEPDCYRVCREICEDLLIMSEEEVEQKPYPFVLEMFFYTQKELVPKNKHWETIQVLEFDKDSNTYKSKITL